LRLRQLLQRLGRPLTKRTQGRREGFPPALLVFRTAPYGHGSETKTGSEPRP